VGLQAVVVDARLVCHGRVPQRVPPGSVLESAAARTARAPKKDGKWARPTPWSYQWHRHTV